MNGVHSTPVAQRSYRCMVVEDETLVAMGLQSALENLGHRVIAMAADADDAERIFRTEEPDLVFTDIRLRDHASGPPNVGSAAGDGLDLAARLLKIRACPILVLSAFSEPELIERASEIGVFGYLIKPATEAALAAQIEISIARFREHMVLLAEKQSLAQNLENRKLVERAKAVLIKRGGLTEAEAHKRLQQESQKRRTGMAELARKIIETEELIEGK